MTEQEAEKEIVSLQEQCDALRRENKELKKHTATSEDIADIVRNLYAQYLIRCAMVREMTIKSIPEADIDEQRKLRQNEWLYYRGAQALYCLLFNKRKTAETDWISDPPVCRSIVSDKAMQAKATWAEALSRERKTQYMQYKYNVY